MKKIIFLLPFVALYFSVAAQDKMLTLEDALVNNRSSLSPQNLKQLQFVYGTDDYVYLDKKDNKELWVRGNAKKNGATDFLTLEELNAKLKAAGRDGLTAMPVIYFNKSAEWIFTLGGSKVALNPVTNTLRTLVDKTILNKEIVEESVAGYVAYVDNNNLFVSKGTDSKQVTADGSSDIVYASSVHRDEFGIMKGTFWSNDGKRLAFYRMDQSMVTDYPIIDWTQRPAKAVNIKYPMAGDKSHHVTVGVYNAETGSLVYLNTGEPAEQYLTNIAWSPDNRSVFIAVLNREQNHMKLNQYDAATGAFVKTLFEETDEKYVEPLVPMLFVKNNPSQFIWQSNRDGWNHLYLYDTNGKLLKQLTKGEWEVLEVKGFDDKGGNLFYVSTEASPLTKNLYELNWKTGKTKRITADAFAVHSAQLSNSGNYVLDVMSSAEHARTISLVETNTGKSSVLLEAKNPLAGYALGKMNIFTIKNTEGTPLYSRLYKPAHFDSTKKYPVIVYWYGGPHAQMITAGFNGGSGDYWFQYMAERGYLVFTLDPRGSDNRGKAFEQVMFRKAGEAQMQDLMSGVNYLKSLPYADQNNMGLFGWSYGGFMTIDFMLNHPGVFKTAVAGGPVTDWKYYEVMYTERYMDTPQENPEGYAATDLTRQVGKLKGKLLLIHGLQDNVVVQQHSVRFVRAAIDKGVQVDYMIYPGHEHNVLGKDRAHLYQKVSDYFEQNLPKTISSF
jgi:dipeptidyl-peptidase-4